MPTLPPTPAVRALALVVLTAAGAAGCRSTPSAAAPPELDAEALAASLELAQPGPEHEALTALAGDWRTVNVLHVTPDAEPVEEPGRTEARAMLEGRFLELASTATMFGEPVASRTVLGFDRRRGLYTLVGFDTMGTYWVSAEGERDADGVIRMHGSDPDPLGEQVYRFELELDGDDRWTLRVVFERIGEVVYDPPFTVVETTAERVDQG